jgi:hypothetical protein
VEELVRDEGVAGSNPATPTNDVRGLARGPSQGWTGSWTASKGYWAPKWVSCNALDGPRQHIMFEAGFPLLFKTRAECRAFIKERWGYIATRRDLRVEPHGWRLPVAVRVKVEICKGE